MTEAAIKIKEKKSGQRACDEKDAKGEACLGHLKLWPRDRWPAELAVTVGPKQEIYRCERCHTLYRPAAEDRSSAGLKFENRPVNILGAFVRSSDK